MSNPARKAPVRRVRTGAAKAPTPKTAHISPPPPHLLCHGDGLAALGKLCQKLTSVGKSAELVELTDQDARLIKCYGEGLLLRARQTFARARVMEEAARVRALKEGARVAQSLGKAQGQ